MAPGQGAAAYADMVSGMKSDNLVRKLFSAEDIGLESILELGGEPHKDE